MEHVDSEVVLGVDICPRVDQKLTDIWIPLEGGEVEGAEAVTAVFRIDPGCHLLRGQLGAGVVQKGLDALDAVVEGALVKEGLAISVRDFANQQFFIGLQIRHYLHVVVVLDQRRTLFLGFSALTVDFAALGELDEGLVTLELASRLEGKAVDLNIHRGHCQVSLPSVFRMTRA